MVELATIAFVTSLLAMQASGMNRQRMGGGGGGGNGWETGPVPIAPHSTSDFRVDPSRNDIPVNLPTIEPRTAEPPSLPWDSVGNDQLFAQGDRYIEMHFPDIYIPKQEVQQEPEKVQRNPLYPDDLRGYDLSRARTQNVLKDTLKRNYAFDGYHIPYSVRNATHQETAQSASLAGRRAHEYTSGATDRNPVVTNIKDPSATIVRRQANHYIDDRAMYQTWDKRQHEELVDVINQPATVEKAIINEPTSWVQPAKVRAVPRYLNAIDNQHGYVRLSARDQRHDGTVYDPLKMKRLLLLGDEGFPSSQVTHFGGHEIDGDALTYPLTTRRREILPALSFPGLFQHGTGWAMRSQNAGNTTGGRTTLSELETRDVIIPKFFGYPHTIGESYQQFTEPPFRLGADQNPTVDFVKAPTVHPTYHSKGDQYWWADNVHIVSPLTR